MTAADEPKPHMLREILDLHIGADAKQDAKLYFDLLYALQVYIRQGKLRMRERCEDAIQEQLDRMERGEPCELFVACIRALEPEEEGCSIISRNIHRDPGPVRPVRAVRSYRIGIDVKDLLRRVLDECRAPLKAQPELPDPPSDHVAVLISRSLLDQIRAAVGEGV